jgi:hypothetical protein
MNRPNQPTPNQPTPLSTSTQDLPGALVAHIREGVAVAAKDPSAVVVFSGARVRACVRA